MVFSGQMEYFNEKQQKMLHFPLNWRSFVKNFPHHAIVTLSSAGKSNRRRFQS